MKSGLTWVVLVLLAFPALGSKQTQNSLVLSAGEERIIKVPNLKGISNPGDILEDIVLGDGESIILRAVSWGETQIMAWDHEGNQITYRITVQVPKYVTELEGFLQSLEGASVSFLGKNIIVEGQILRASDGNRLDGILNTFPQVKNMVIKQSPPIDTLLLDAARAETDNRSLKAESLGAEGFIIEGDVLSERSQKKANSVIGFYFDSVYPTLSVNNPEITIDAGWVAVASESRSTPFAGFIGAVGHQESAEIWPYSFHESLSHSDTLNQIRKSGSTQVLSETRMEVRSGHLAQWAPTPQGKAGLSVDCTPVVIDDRWIDCELEIALVQGGRKTAAIQKRVVVKRGQGLALAGVLEAFEKNAGGSAVKDLLQGDPSLAKLIQADPKGDLVLVLTPNWRLRS